MLLLFILILCIGIVLFMKFSKPKNTRYIDFRIGGIPTDISDGPKVQSVRSRKIAEAALSRSNVE